MLRADPLHADFIATKPTPRFLWNRGRFLMLLAAIVFVAYGVYFVGRPDKGEWHSVYTTAASHMLACEGIHASRDGYAYPPAMAFLVTPLARLSPVASLLAWYLINVWALYALFVGAWRLAGGPALAQVTDPWRIVAWLAPFLVLRFAMNTLALQQFDLVIAALLLIGCNRLWHGHELSAGGWLGAAAAMKCTPLLFAPYLLWRGRFKGAAVLVLVALGLNFLPDLVFPQTAGHSYMADWYRWYLSGVVHAPPGFWHTDLLLNQSLGGLFNRALQFSMSQPLSQAPDAVPAAAVLGIRVLNYAAALLLVILTAWQMGRPLRRAVVVPDGAQGPLSWDKLQTGCEVAAVLALMLLISPMSGKAHYVTLLLPAMLFSRLLVERKSRSLFILLALLLVAGPLTAKDLVGKSLGDWTLFWGFPTWFALLALLGTWRAMRASRAVPVSVPVPQLDAGPRAPRILRLSGNYYGA